jgi:hypothetical protein
MANTPDHWNAYVTLGASALSIVGTLGGLWLGSFIQQKRDDAQRKYTDRTRFHDVRLDAYTKFAAATVGVMGAAKVWANESAPVSIATYLGTHDRLSPYSKSLSLVRLVASPGVKQRAGGVNECCIRVLEVTIHADMEPARQELIAAITIFEVAARNELGIE